MAKIIVLGAGGRLGASLARDYAAAGHDVIAWGRGEADLGNPSHVAGKIRGAGADAVINCAAMTNVDECETEFARARLVNAEAPGAIAQAATQICARMIHISTDYVFPGNTDRPCAEDADAAPISIYGETKFAGEQAILGEGNQHAVVRVSWVFGPDRDSFVDKALQTALRGEQVRAVADKWSSPSYTRDIGESLRALLNPDAPGGIYHICNSGRCTWRDWAAEALDVAKKAGLLASGIEVEPIKLSDISAMIAKRPVHTVMSCQRIEALQGKPMRPWQQAVAEYIQNRYIRGSSWLKVEY